MYNRCFFWLKMPLANRNKVKMRSSNSRSLASGWRPSHASCFLHLSKGFRKFGGISNLLLVRNMVKSGDGGGFWKRRCREMRKEDNRRQTEVLPTEVSGSWSSQRAGEESACASERFLTPASSSPSAGLRNADRSTVRRSGLCRDL